MIQLFNIQYVNFDTKSLGNLLHGTVINEFESLFCEYVGAKYACSVNSATNAIFLCLFGKKTNIKIPSIIPPVVLNSIIHSDNLIEFIDNIEWVGGSYVLHDFGDYKIIDSAQKVNRNQFASEANSSDLMIFSFYPTKPVGSCDGGIIVSNDENKIQWLKEATMNGMTYANNNWERKIKFPGWKMYMNSVQSYMALQNLYKLDEKKSKIAEIRNFYNKAFGLNNTSDHLYRISVKNNDIFLDFAKNKGIICGKHYTASHLSDVYKPYCINNKALPLSEKTSVTTASIPMHEGMDIQNAEYITDVINEYNKSNSIL